MEPNNHQKIHPGTVLFEVYLRSSNPPLTVAALSRTIGVSQRHLTEFIRGRRPVTTTMAGRLGVICRTAPQYWLELQRTYDRERSRRLKTRTSSKAAA